MRKVVIICIAILVIGIGVSVAVSGQAQQLVDDAREAQQRAASELSAAQDARAAAQADVVADAVGISADTIDADRTAIRTVVEIACTWASFDDYTAARDKLAQEFGLSVDEGLLSDFLGKVDEWTTESGRNANTIDERGLAMRLDDLDSRLIRNDGSEREYFCIAKVGDDFKDGSGDATVVFRATLDSKSHVKAIDAVEGFTSGD